VKGLPTVYEKEMIWCDSRRFFTNVHTKSYLEGATFSYVRKLLESGFVTSNYFV
jgi:hypothetical protein